MNAEKQAEEYLFNLMLKFCKPLYCHEVDAPWPRPVKGGTCFFLRFGDVTFGVTAAHVIEVLLGRHRERRQVFQVGNAGIDLEHSLIDLDTDLDIATFRFDRTTLEEIGGMAFVCSADDWPPPSPKPLWKLGFVGFPEKMTEVKALNHAEFLAYGSMSAVEDVSDRDIICTYDPARDEAMPGFAKPDLGFNMSGCSGGPAIMYYTSNGLTRWRPVGLIYKGPLGRAEGESEEFDIIRIRLLKYVKPDGTLKRDASGWLP